MENQILELTLLLVVIILGFFAFLFPPLREVTRENPPVLYDKIKEWLSQNKDLTKE